MKKVFAFLLVFTLIFSLFGCSEEIKNEDGTKNTIPKIEFSKQVAKIIV